MDQVNPKSPSGLNQMNHPTSAMVGKDLGSTGGPHYAQSQNKHAFMPYGLPPNYTPPNVAYTPSENVNNSTPILIESRQPQTDHAHVSQPMGETYEIPHHNLADFEPWLGYATEGQAVGGIPLENTSEGPQYHPQLHLLHSTTTGANKEGEDEGEARAVTAIPIQPSFPPTQQCHYSANNQPSPYPPPSYPQRPSLKQPQSLPTALPMTNTTFSINQNTNQEMNFAARKPIEFTPIPVSYADLLPYLLENSMVAITPTMVHQPPFLREYNSKATCACHGEAPGHSIEHCRALKRKVQGLIDAGWLKFEENHV
ncbi:hypothetical protein HKD37_U058146 [Glycine soja]